MARARLFPAFFALAPGLARTLAPAFAATLACAPAAPPPPPAPELPPPPALLLPAPELPATSPSQSTTTSATPPLEAPCRNDDHCGYDPAHARCGTDPRFNKQPPLIDQGLVCYCQPDAGTCALLRVDPAPCEGDTSCAVRLDPRPHPIRKSAEHPYAKPRKCRAAKAGQPSERNLFVTCERTNICTMHTRECARP